MIDWLENFSFLTQIVGNWSREVPSDTYKR